jgi:predicted ferric reductase
VPGLVWVAAYIGLAAFPLAILLFGPMPRGGGFWWDFSMALGFGGLALMGLQFVLTARFRRLFAPFGIDIIYYFHRWIAIGGTALIVAHYLIIRVLHPESLGPADPRYAPWHLSAGRLALVAIVALVVTSLWRKALRLHYDAWRVGHALLAATAMILAIVHVHGVGHYTAAPWKNALWLAYSVAWLAVLGHIRLVKPALLLRRPYRVTNVWPERGASWTVTLKPVHGERLAFSPGQFAWLSLGTNPFRMKEHPFSFSGSAKAPNELQFTIKELGDFTRTIKNLPVGTIAYVDGPYGRFTTDLHPRAAGFVFIAGGVGIAPIMSMLRTLADRGDRRPIHLIYGSWRRTDTLFLEALDALAKRLTLHVTHVLQQPPEDWPGEVGLIAEAVLARVLPVEATHYPCFVCGPKAMTDYVLPSLRSLGFPLRNQHTELFEMV